jgi:hypothetical protein
MDDPTSMDGRACTDERSDATHMQGGGDGRVNSFDPFRCRRCGEPIGVYEPVALAGAGGTRITSRAAEPDLGGPEGIYFHRDCCEDDEADAAADADAAAAAAATRQRSAWRRASGAGPPA